VRRIPIRVKLAIALSVPLIAVGLVTLIEVVSVADEASDVRQQAQLATATIGPKGLITALQDERNYATAQLVGVDKTLPLTVTGYPESRGATDAALADFEGELDKLTDAARTAYTPALEGLAALQELRAEIDVEAAKPNLGLDNIGLTTGIFYRYTDLIEPFFGGMSRISIAMDDPELRQGAELMETVTRQLETVPQLTNSLVMPASVPTAPGDRAGINAPTEIATLADSHDTFRRQAEALRAASGAYADLAAEWFPEEFTAAIDAAVDQGITTGAIDVEATLATLNTSPGDESHLPYIGYRDAVARAIEDRADEITDEAVSRQRRFGVLMALTFAAAVSLTILVSLSITRPLRSLTRQAKEMAERRLPGAVTDILEIPLGEDVVVPQVAPVRVGTRDEVADVADALNKVQDSALDLALEQAVLRRNIADSFVNLGRRNQNLLGRQLDFITELESRETDPDTLASLFRLDHLATRMRRNAESLLVLAGIEPPRQWAAPVRITDVVRAALGEVESYERVTVRGVAPATVQGSAAADLAHLLAELIENALVFSPPDQSVDIRGAAQRAGHGAGYTLAVMDSGLGMPPADIEAANRRLAGVESFTVAPSKYLGHYVAGNLAARHGIRVHLRSSPGSGVIATVELPPEILTPDTGTRPTPVGTEQDQRHLGQGPAPAVPSLAPAGLGVGNDGRDRGSMAPTEDQWASLARLGDQDRAWEAPAPAARPPAAPPADVRWQDIPTGGRLPASPAPQPQAPPPQAPRWSEPQPRLPQRGAPQWSQPQQHPQQQPPQWSQPQAAPPPAPRPQPEQVQRVQQEWTQAAQPAPRAEPTPGGQPPLTRRDRGAQMPVTNLRPIRGGSPAETPAGRPAAQPPVHRPRAAEEVYGFLSSFTAGVQRGLDAAGSGAAREPDDRR
jgi:signal transduction histidine kinase